MPGGPLQGVLHQLHRIVGEASDGTLLRAFVNARDEQAFALLVERHGPMVLGVCRRVLGNLHDAEDAFQATFLVLARKAGAVRPPDLVGNWLYGVAYRIALEARSRIAQRNMRERPLSDVASVESADDNEEVKRVIDQEVDRLPDKYRVPVVLCELEGRSRKEAAEVMQVPEGTLSSRLATARKILADRLAARGLALPAAGFGVLLAPSAVDASLGALATLIGCGAAPTHTQAVILAEVVMKAMFLAKLRTIALWSLTLGTATVALALVATAMQGSNPTPPQQANQKTDARTETKTESKTETKNEAKAQLPAFTRIHVKQGTVVIRQTGRAAIDKRDDARIENGELVLTGQNPSVAFTVEVAELDSLKVDGVGKIAAEDLKGKKLDVVVTSAATVVLAGFVEEQSIRVPAGATVDAQACKGTTGTVHVASGGRAVVNISAKLDATVNAGGTLEYVGGPKIVFSGKGGNLLQRTDAAAVPTVDVPGKEPNPKPKDEPLPPGALVLSAVVDGYTQGTQFNLQKYPFKYTGVAALNDEQLKTLAKPGEVADATAKALLACLLWPKENDVLQKASLKSDGKKLAGAVEVLHKYGKQGTHVLALTLEGTIVDGRLTELRVTKSNVTGTWDSGFPITLKGEVTVTITPK